MNKKPVEDLISLADEMAKYYYKRFGFSIVGTFIDVSGFVYSLEDSYKNRFELNILFPLSDYESIPFEKLTGREEFKPLFSVRALLLEYYALAHKIFESQEEAEFKQLDILEKEIISLGREYNNTFGNVLQTIRNHSEYRDFEIKIYDDKGDVFLSTEVLHKKL